MYKVVNKIIKYNSYISRDERKNILSQITNIIQDTNYTLKNKLKHINDVLKIYKRPVNYNRQKYIFNKISSWFNNYINEKLVENSESFSMLDIGGGNGYILSKFGTKYNLSQKNLICLENDKTEFKYKYDLSNITYCFNTNILLNNPIQFNIISCIVSLHHMTDEYILYTIIPLIKTKLQRDGLFLIKEHDAYSDDIIENINWEHHLYHILDKSSDINMDTYIDNYIGNYKSMDKLQKILENNGFKLVNTFTNIFEQTDEKFNSESNKTPTKLYWQLYSL